MITITDVLEILKDYGGHTKKVWLYNVDSTQKVMLKYDSTRRYFMSQIEFRNGKCALQRVPKDVFVNNVEYLINKGFHICF